MNVSRDVVEAWVGNRAFLLREYPDLKKMPVSASRKVRAIRFSTLNAICGALSCQPGDILRFEPDEERELASNKENFK